jgi:hypothetical protein
MKIIKSVRIRPSNGNIEERLGINTFNQGNLKGGISDIKATILQIEEGDRKNSPIGVPIPTDAVFVMEWLPIGEVNALTYEFLSKDQFNEYLKQIKKSEKQNSTNFFGNIGGIPNLLANLDNYLPGSEWTDVFFKNVMFNQGNLKQRKNNLRRGTNNYYHIVQNPWGDEPPMERAFGVDPYYLNNGAKINIYWMIKDRFPLPYTPDIVNLFSPQITPPIAPAGSSGSSASVGLTGPSASNPGDGLSGYDWIGQTLWSDGLGLERDTLIADTIDNGLWKNPKTNKVENYPIKEIQKYVLILSPKENTNGNFNYEEAFTVLDHNLTDFGLLNIKEKNIPQDGPGFYKALINPNGVSGASGGTGASASTQTPINPLIILSGLSGGTGATGATAGLTPSIPVQSVDKLKPIIQVNRDDDIIAAIIDIWKRKVPNYDRLTLCNPSYYPTLEVGYLSPFKSGTGGTGSTDNSNNSQSKIDLFVQLPEFLDLKTKVDMPAFKIYAGGIPTLDPDNIFTDEIEQFFDDDEFVEADFDAEGEAVNDIANDIELPIIIDQMKIEIEQRDGPGSADPISGGGGGNSLPDGNGKRASVPTDSPGGQGTFAVGFNGVPHYYQCDPRWGSTNYDGRCKESSGKLSSLCSSACGPSSLTMCINFWAKKGYCSATSIPDICAMAARGGGRVCNSGTAMYGAWITEIKKTFGIIVKSSSESEVVAAAKKGYPGVISGAKWGSKGSGKTFKADGSGYSNTTPGHFVCITGVDSKGYVRVNDPGRRPGEGCCAYNTKPSDSHVVKSAFLVYPEKLPPK